MPIKLTNDEKVEILKQILPQFWDEATHWREDSWRFTTWLVSIFAAIAGISVYTDKGLPIAALILLLLSISGSVYLAKNYNSYKDRIKLFLMVEEALLFFEDDIYVKGRSLLPKDRLDKKVTLVGQGTYLILIWIVAAVSLGAIAFKAGWPHWFDWFLR